MKTSQEIIAAIGNEVLRVRLGVGYTAITNAAARGVFPASWFKVVSQLCEDRGIECPDSLFSFKGSAS